MKSVTSNRPLLELVAEAKAEVMEEIEDNREEAEEDDAMDLTVVPNLDSLYFSLFCPFLFKIFGESTVSERQHMLKQDPLK